MASGCLRKRTHSSKSSESLSRPSSRVSSPDLVCGKKPHQRKIGRFTSQKLENDSSRDSFSHSNFILSESEDTSDSEFEDHPYSRSAFSLNEIQMHSLSKSESVVGIGKSKIGNISKVSKRSKCTSKNAVMARLNRLKKKKYIQDLEDKTSELEAENQRLKYMLDMRAHEVASLKRKTLNLESVIRNKTEIGSLLRCVSQHTNLKISSSLLRGEPSNPSNQETVLKSTSGVLNELETSPFEEEGNDIFSFAVERDGSPLDFLDIIEEKDTTSDHSYPLLSDVGLDSLFKPNCFELPESPESACFGGSSGPARCETPSKGFTADLNKENLFGDVGVCFHIGNNKVSLEFCDTCNLMATM